MPRAPRPSDVGIIHATRVFMLLRTPLPRSGLPETSRRTSRRRSWPQLHPTRRPVILRRLRHDLWRKAARLGRQTFPRARPQCKLEKMMQPSRPKQQRPEEEEAVQDVAPDEDAVAVALPTCRAGNKFVKVPGRRTPEGTDRCACLYAVRQPGWQREGSPWP